MFAIVLEFPKRVGGKDPKEVLWLAVHSFFEYLFPEEFLCVLKPYNKSESQAKVFFKRKISIPDDNNQVEIDSCLGSIVDCQDEENLSATRTCVLKLPARPSNLDAVASELGAWFKVRINCLPDPASVDGLGVLLSISACHEEVLELAIDRISKLKCPTGLQAASSDIAAGSATSVLPMQPAPAPAVQPAAAAPAEASGRQRPRKPLFSPELIAAADAREAEEASKKQQLQPEQQQTQQQKQPEQQQTQQQKQPEQQQRQQSQPGVFHLKPACQLTIERVDLTSIGDVDLLVATTNGVLSLKYGLANALATRWGFETIQADCQCYLSSIRGGAIPFGETFFSQRGQILFVVLPNDRRLESQLGRGRQFRQAVDSCLDETMQQLVRLAGSDRAPGYQRVAMPTLGSTLPLWGEDNKGEWAEALARALSRLSGAAGHLRVLRVCCVNDEAARLLGDAVARQLGALRRGAGSDEPLVATAPPSSSAESPASRMDIDEDSAAAAVSCALCAEDFSANNPPTPFHCSKQGERSQPKLCAACVARLENPELPSDGKCVICFQRYRPAVGNQPSGGRMSVSNERESLPGHADCGTLVIQYDFDPGVDEDGNDYKGLSRTAYLPDSPEGRSIAQRLQIAFHGRALFNVGASATTGRATAITWNTVHHKTNRTGGTARHGYPDDSFLQRTSDELSALGY